MSLPSDLVANVIAKYSDVKGTIALGATNKTNYGSLKLSDKEWYQKYMEYTNHYHPYDNTIDYRREYIHDYWTEKLRNMYNWEQEYMRLLPWLGVAYSKIYSINRRYKEIQEQLDSLYMRNPASQRTLLDKIYTMRSSARDMIINLVVDYMIEHNNFGILSQYDNIKDALLMHKITYDHPVIVDDDMDFEYDD